MILTLLMLFQRTINDCIEEKHVSKMLECIQIYK